MSKQRAWVVGAVAAVFGIVVLARTSMPETHPRGASHATTRGGEGSGKGAHGTKRHKSAKKKRGDKGEKGKKRAKKPRAPKPDQFTERTHDTGPAVAVKSTLRPSAILIITTDTTRADRLGVYGHKKQQLTPAIDRLASEGVRIAHGVSTMPTTDPAHLSMFTGLYPRSHGVLRNGQRLEGDVPNLGAWAKSQGYATAAFVSRSHVEPKELGLAGFDAQSGPKDAERDGRKTVDEALTWLDEHGREPFFLWVHVFEPHQPYRPNSEYMSRFVPPQLRKVRKHKGLSKAAFDELRRASSIAKYDAEIAYMDSLVDKLVRHVRGLRVAQDPPLIVLVADHGEAMDELFHRFGFAFDHGRYLYQNLIHVPMLFVWPGKVPAGKVVDAPVDLVDISATLFDLIDAPGFKAQGKSAVPYFSAAPKQPVYAFAERRFFSNREQLGLSGEQQFSVMDSKHQLIVSLPEGDEELLELTADPGTPSTLAARLPKVRDRLRKALDRWLAETPPAKDVNLEIAPDRIEVLRSLGYVQ